MTRDVVVVERLESGRQAVLQTLDVEVSLLEADQENYCPLDDGGMRIESGSDGGVEVLSQLRRADLIVGHRLGWFCFLELVVES